MKLKCTKRTRHFARMLLLAFLVAAIGSSAASAQDYKEAYNNGLEAAKAKNYDEAYAQFSRAVEGAKQAGDADVEKRAAKVLAQLDYRNGLKATKAENYEEALTHFDKGIAHYPTNAKNYLGKALALKKLDRMDDAMAMFLKAKEVAEANGDRKTARTAEKAIRDQYIFLASSTLSKKGDRTGRAEGEQALAYLEEMQKYVEPDADAYYYMAEAYKAMGNYEQAVAMADKALELHRGSRTDKAKIYFVKGEALMAMQDYEGAKAAFRNAAYGSYKATAQHYIETLGTR